MSDGVVRGETARGEATIDVLALNRAGLVRAREASAVMLRARVTAVRLSLERLDVEPTDRRLDEAVQEELGMLSRLLGPEQPYAALHRQFINNWLAELGIEAEQFDPRVREIRREAESKAAPITEERERRTAVRSIEHAARQQDYSVEAETPAQRAAFFTGKKWIEWIKLRNFKAIERLDLDFPAPQTEREPWLVMLGENGTGKSSVLQALAIALMGEHHCAELKLDASGFMRRGAKRGAHGRIRVKLANVPEPLEVRFSRTSPRFTFTTADPKVLLLAYGATRLLRARRDAAGTDPKRIRIENLFDPTAPLADVERWLLDPDELDETRFGAVGDAFRELLMLTPDDSFSRAGGRVHALLQGEAPIPLEQLSDGFQSVVALCADVMKSLLERFDSMEDAEGIVLLDEIEAHLHPTWKIEIVERLRRTFPRVMFVVSTHDPLCLKGLYEGEIVLLRRDEQRKIEAETDVPPVDDLRADQILTSPLFGLQSTRGDETTGAIERYAELVGKARPSAAERDELEALRARLETTLSTGDNGRQRRIEQAIWNTLVTEEAPSPPPRRRPPKPSPDELELRRQLKELLEP
jgi:predicted ATPase